MQLCYRNVLATAQCLVLIAMIVINYGAAGIALYTCIVQSELQPSPSILLLHLSQALKVSQSSQTPRLLTRTQCTACHPAGPLPSGASFS